MTKAGCTIDKSKATPPPPVAMPSRKRLQPQTKSKFKYNIIIQCFDIPKAKIY